MSSLSISKIAIKSNGASNLIGLGQKSRVESPSYTPVQIWLQSPKRQFSFSEKNY